MRFLTLVPLLWSAVAGAQEVAPEEGDASEQGGSLPIAGYEKNGFNGFFIQTADGEFRLELGGYSQFRYSLTFRQDAPPGEEDVERGFSVSRTRLFATGNFTRRMPFQLRANIDAMGNIELLVAYGAYTFGPDRNQYVRVGKQFFPLSREDWMFAQDYLGLEFSENDFTYAIGASSGALYHHALKSFRYWVGVSNGAYGGKEDFPTNLASDLAVTSRFDFLLAGDDWAGFNDLVGRKGRPFAMMWGLAAGYQGKYRAGEPIPHAGQAITDLSVSGDGFHAMVSGIYTWRRFDAGGGMNDLGVLVEGAYWVHPMIAPYARYNFLHRFDTPGIEPWNSVALGVGLYPFEWTNRIHFNLEGSYAFNGIDQTVVAPSGALGWLASSDPQFALRMQAQFGF